MSDAPQEKRPACPLSFSFILMPYKSLAHTGLAPQAMSQECAGPECALYISEVEQWHEGDKDMQSVEVGYCGIARAILALERMSERGQ